MDDPDLTFVSEPTGGSLWAADAVAEAVACQLREQGLSVDLSPRDLAGGPPRRIVAHRRGGGVRLGAGELRTFVAGQYGVCGRAGPR